MKYAYIERTKQGYRIYTYDSTEKRDCHYIGYSLRAAVQKWRRDYGYSGKRFTWIEL